MQELPLRIVLVNPPAGVDFGLQQGSGHTYQTIQTQRSTTHNLVFSFTVRVKGDAATDPAPTLLGPFVQGPPSGRFVYLDIGTAAGQVDSAWSRRLKIPLTITWPLIEQVSTHPEPMLETQVAGTGKDGTPTCGTVKPFAGWQVVNGH
ncbi:MULTISPECIES: DUF5990 family protein [unclassified Spirosoma]|uniref:DUF5990 family protein n=1 Tax=unclassified Spirosoma TaxID=2621999 RepID=UPI00096295AE|nr:MULTISPECIES: DUF5990 family protein [unclassified Spirosoma]MBN8821989.1 hypothetical protein [Spirosoma sp.]OJW80403.1 MAG: hypothetical protein BGO59_33475 [Spirosoma sp. 48-14]